MTDENTDLLTGFPEFHPFYWSS